MNDYLRARIEALENEVHRLENVVQKLEKQIYFNQAMLENAKENFGFNYFTNSTQKSKQ